MWQDFKGPNWEKLLNLYPELSPLQAVLKLAHENVKTLYECIIQHPDNFSLTDDALKIFRDDIDFVQEAIDMFSTSKQLGFDENDKVRLKNIIFDCFRNCALGVHNVEQARTFLKIAKIFVDFCN